MIAALATAAIGLACMAGALELWGRLSAERRRRSAAALTEARLASREATSANGNPAVPLTAAQAALAARLPTAALAPASIPLPAGTLPAWRAVLRRANLRDGSSTWVWLLLPGIVLAIVAGLRLHSTGFALLAAALYAIALTLWLRRRIERQQQQLLRMLPDFLENMVRLSGIGNSLSMAFQTAAQQVTPPLRPMLDSALLFTRGGMDLDRALLQAGKPYRLPAVDTLALVLGTSLRIGGRSDQIIQRMSDFMRDLQQMQQELGATTAETRMSAWVIGLLPPASALFMALTSPEFFRPMLDQPLGHKLLLGAVLLEALGALLLYRLARSL